MTAVFNSMLMITLLLSLLFFVLLSASLLLACVGFRRMLSVAEEQVEGAQMAVREAQQALEEAKAVIEGEVYQRELAERERDAIQVEQDFAAEDELLN